MPLPEIPAPPGRRTPRRDEVIAERELLQALCRCAAGCAQTFADEAALLAHRPRGRCLPPATAGLNWTSGAIPCWTRPEEES